MGARLLPLFSIASQSERWVKFGIVRTYALRREDVTLARSGNLMLKDQGPLPLK